MSASAHDRRILSVRSPPIPADDASGCFVRSREPDCDKPMTDMVKVFGCRQAYENRPSTNRGPQARVYGDLVFSLVVVTVAPALRWVGDGLARGDSSPGEL